MVRHGSAKPLSLGSNPSTSSSFRQPDFLRCFFILFGLFICFFAYIFDGAKNKKIDTISRALEGKGTQNTEVVTTI